MKKADSNEAREVWSESCQVFKPAKHKMIDLENGKIIHLLHFNEEAASEPKPEPETDNTNTNNHETSISQLVPQNSPQLVATKQAVSFDVLPEVKHEALLNESIISSSLKNDNKDEVSIRIKPEDIDKKPLESYETFSQLLISTKFKSKKLKHNLECLDGGGGKTSQGFSVFFKSKIKLEAKTFEHMNNLQSQLESTSRPLLFFIHGVAGSSLIWKSQLEFFSEKGYEIIAMDLIGHGHSSVAKEASMYEFMEISGDITKIFDKFASKSKNNVVIAHSYGCSFAIYLAQHRKDFIAKLILVGGGKPYPVKYSPPLQNAPRCCIKLLRPFLYCCFFR
jgi:hypothetical protein